MVLFLFNDKMATKLKFENNDSIQPIDHQLIKGKIKHVLVTIPALDERWVQDRKFAFYVFPPTKLQNGSYIPGAVETWKSSMSCLLDDIWWLCELSYHKFWSQVIYNKNSINGIKSFLHLAPLQKLYYKTKDTDILSTYKRVKKAVFQFLKRISRPKESELHFLSDSKYREIMSEHELIPVSLVFCICSVYGEKYREDVYTIVSQIFKWNNNLKFERTVLRTIQLFDHLNKKLKVSYRELKRNLLCCENSSDVTDAANAYRNCLLATLQFLANASMNVSNFLSIYKEGCQAFLNHDFDFHLIRVYVKLLIPLAQEIYILFQDCPQTRTSSWLYSLIDLTRLELTKTFEICLSTSLSSMSDARITQDFIQRHIKLMKNALKTEEFLQDLNSYCNVVDIIDKIRRKCPGNLDLSDVDQITETIKEFLSKTDSDSPTEKRKSADVDGELVQWNEIIDYVKEYYDSDELCSGSGNAYANGGDGMFLDDHLSDYSNWSDDNNSNSEYESYFAASDEEHDDSVLPVKVTSSENKTVTSKENDITSKFGDLSLQPASTSSNYTPDMTFSQVQLHSAIAHVKDILPHLGDGFVAMCLEYYKMDPSAVINAVLEENLPQYLRSVDFCLPQIAADVQQKIDSSLQNIIVGDDKNNLRELKRVEYSSYAEMLNDKKEIRVAKNVYENYRNVEEDELYDDDFDEEMDEKPVAALEVDPEGFYTEYAKVPLQNYNRSKTEQLKSRVSDDEDEENEEDSGPSNGPKPLDFCENPEIIRARREHQRQVNLNRKYPRNNINRNNRKDSQNGNNADEKHEKSSKSKNSSENHEKHDKFSSNRKNFAENPEKRDKFSSPRPYSYDNRWSQNRNSDENQRKDADRGRRDECSSKNRSSYENRDRRDQPPSQSRSYENRVDQDRSFESRLKQNQPGSQNQNSYENREKQDQYSQSRNSYENRDDREQSSSQSRSFESRTNQYGSQNRNSYEHREKQDQYSQNRNSYENRDDHEQPFSQSRSFDSRTKQNQFGSENRNSYENRGRQDQYSQSKNSYENRDDHEVSSSHSRSFESRLKQNQHGSQNQNSYENRDDQDRSFKSLTKQNQHGSQNRNLYHSRDDHDRSFESRSKQNNYGSQNRNSYESRDDQDRSFENRTNQNQQGSQNRNSYENRDDHDRSFESRTKQNQYGSQNQNSYENRNDHDRSFESRTKQNQYGSQNRNSYENRDDHDRSFDRSFESRTKQNQYSSQNRNSYENRNDQDRSFESRAKQNHHSSQNRNSYENREKHDQPFSSQNRWHDDREKQDQYSRNRNSYEDQEQTSQHRNSYENRSSKNNGGENSNYDRERHLKNVHKARNANHSRKFFSDKKRNF